MPTKLTKLTKRTKSTKSATPIKAVKTVKPAKPVRPARAGGEMLGLRALNRAMLERQMLLARAEKTPFDAIEHLVGVQAQEPKSPYVGLWTRLEHFRPEELEELLTTRRAVRIIVMRGTIHLISARDCAMMRPLTQPIMDRWMKSNREIKTHLAGVDMSKLASAARKLLEQQPRTVAQAAKALAEKWPGRDLTTIGLAVRAMLPLVQCPPRGLWHDSGQVVCATAEHWLDRPLESGGVADGLILRYLAAFGPSTIRDMESWAGLTRFRECVERLRPRLRVFQNEAGKELFDLPRAPRPDPDTPAPPRFLPEFDNVLLAHDDRSRIIARDRRGVIVGGHRTLLVDGFTRATWRIARKDPVTKRENGAATLVIDLFLPLSKKEVGEVTAEGYRLLKFAAHDATAHDVRINPPA